MTRQRWVFAGIAAILLAGSGCVSCGHRGYQLARVAGTSCELPACQRNQVHVFAMSGLNPISVMALDGLAEELHRQGFAKVATGQTIHAGWMAREMRRIRNDESDAVFVVVGFESRAAAVRLAEKAAAEGLPVSGVVVIDSKERRPRRSRASARCDRQCARNALFAIGGIGRRSGRGKLRPRDRLTNGQRGRAVC